MMTRTVAVLTALFVAGCSSPPRSAGPSSALYAAVEVGVPIPQQPYRPHTTTDRLGRSVRFYLSDAPSDASPLPLVVYVHGSGPTSLFVERDGRVRPTLGHASVADVVRGRARLLIVEKPGVRYLDDPARPSLASDEFRHEHTLDRWAEAVGAATRAAQRLDAIAPGRVLVAGHSEGGVVAARLAAEHPYVSHVAVLAGEGPSQLYSLMAFARRGVFFQHVSDDPEVRVQHVRDQWSRITAAPEAADSVFFGHPYRRWHSFLSTSPLDELLASTADVYLATGTRDDAVTIESLDVLCAQLLSKGRSPVCDRVEGADHSFALEDRARDGWSEVWGRVVDWYLDDRG